MLFGSHLWRNFKRVWQIIEGFYLFWVKFESIIAKNMQFGKVSNLWMANIENTI